MRPNDDAAPDATALRKTLPARLVRDVPDQELLDTERDAQKLRHAVDYATTLIDADAAPFTRIHKGALVLLLEALGHLETALKDVTRDGAVTIFDAHAALDARDVDGFLDSL